MTNFIGIGKKTFRVHTDVWHRGWL